MGDRQNEWVTASSVLIHDDLLRGADRLIHVQKATHLICSRRGRGSYLQRAVQSAANADQNRTCGCGSGNSKYDQITLMCRMGTVYNCPSRIENGSDGRRLRIDADHDRKSARTAVIQQKRRRTGRKGYAVTAGSSA